MTPKDPQTLYAQLCKQIAAIQMQIAKQTQPALTLRTPIRAYLTQATYTPHKSFTESLNALNTFERYQIDIIHQSSAPFFVQQFLRLVPDFWAHTQALAGTLQRVELGASGQEYIQPAAIRLRNRLHQAAEDLQELLSLGTAVNLVQADYAYYQQIQTP